MRNPHRSRGRNAFAAILFATLGSTCHAEVSNLRVTPDPIVCGDVIRFDVDNDGRDPIASWRWDLTYMSNLCTKTWPNWSSSSVPATSQFRTPGDYRVTLTVTYSPPPAQPPMPAHSPTVLSVDFNVAEPDSCVIVKGLNISKSAWNQGSITVEFQLKKGSKNVQLAPDSVAEERINWITPPSGLSPWAGAVPVYYLSEGTKIIDVKTCSFKYVQPYVDQFHNAPLGTTVQNYTQENRIKYKDPCGNWVVKVLCSHHLKWVKSGYDEIELIEVSP